MKKSLLIILALLIFGATACSPTDESVKNNFIGLTVEEAEEFAEANGIVFRIIEEDGQALPVTFDYVEGRINAVVMNGKILDYTVEGA